MKVVSLVPSWTEMLIECGVNVVGRTRFCIHPEDQAHKVVPVGGTKDLDMEKLKNLNADLLVLDQEENLKWMAEQSPIPTLVTHVTSLENVAQEIRKFSHVLPEVKAPLRNIADRWDQVAQKPSKWQWDRIPGEIETIHRENKTYRNLVYVIWKNPWMAVSKNTFIGSVLSHLGASVLLPDFETRYPEFLLEDFDLESTYFLFSSEPFPFHKKVEDLRKLSVHGSVVDGESFSWFGVRSLRFLESY